MSEKESIFVQEVNAFNNNKEDDITRSLTKKAMETTLTHSPDIVDKIAEYKKLARNRDEVVKDLLVNARFTGYILTGLLEELKGMSIDDFCISTGMDPDTGGDLRTKATEFGSSISKAIRLDLLFEVDGDGKLQLRVDIEPQSIRYEYNEINDKSYSLIGRGVYYAAMALATEIQSTKSFHLLRKVYSIWICYERPIGNVYEPILRYSMGPELEYVYHQDNSSIRCNKHKFDDGNLLSVVFISVPDIERAINTNNTNNYKENYDYEFLRGLYVILSSDINIEERKQFYFDSKIIKEERLVSKMQALGLELDMAYAQEIMRKQETAIRERDTVIKERDTVIRERDTVIKERDTVIKERDTLIQKKNLKFACNLLKSGQLDGLTAEESIELIMEEIEVDYDEALVIYNSLFQN